MKNKTKTYILLASVLVIWGVIGYKILSTLEPDTQPINMSNEIATFVPKNSFEVDTFSIQKVNRDPFLGTLYRKKKPKKLKPKPPNKAFVWIPIMYHGVISKKQSNSQVFIVSINQQQNLMKVGQKINGVTLINGNSNIITVGYKGKTKKINKT